MQPSVKKRDERAHCLTFVKSSVRASKESNVPTRKSGIWNCKIQKTSPIHLQPLQHVTTTGSSKRIGACGHFLCPANAMTNLVHWSKYELQSSHFPKYWIRSDNSTFRSAMKRNNTWIPARKRKVLKKASLLILCYLDRSNEKQPADMIQSGSDSWKLITICCFN